MTNGDLKTVEGRIAWLTHRLQFPNYYRRMILFTQNFSFWLRREPWSWKPHFRYRKWVRNKGTWIDLSWMWFEILIRL